MEFTEYINLHKEKVYKTITSYIPNREPKEHYSWVRDYTDRQGKYGRPGYLLLWCELYGGKVENAILPAATMQASEDWVLTHDDWEDDNMVRRGKPTLHILAGEYFAVNAGDAMHMVNWKIAHDTALKLGTTIGNRFYDKFYDILIVTAEGQYYDMRLTNVVKDVRNFTLEEYYKAIAAKAGYYSIYGPMQLGAIVAGQKDSELDKIREYGYPLGVAFQMKDDILDCISDEKTLGKTIGTDVYEGVKTAILWHFVHNANESDLKKVEKIYAKERKDKSPEEVKYVIDMFKEYNSIDFARQKMEEFGNLAVEKFEQNTKHIPESSIKEIARNSVGYAIKRTK